MDVSGFHGQSWRDQFLAVSTTLHQKFFEKEYHHYFYEAKIKDFGDIIFNKEFEINDIKFKWYSYKRIQEVNFDIVEFIKEIK